MHCLVEDILLSHCLPSFPIFHPSFPACLAFIHGILAMNGHYDLPRSVDSKLSGLSNLLAVDLSTCDEQRKHSCGTWPWHVYNCYEAMTPWVKTLTTLCWHYIRRCCLSRITSPANSSNSCVPKYTCTAISRTLHGTWTLTTTRWNVYFWHLQLGISSITNYPIQHICLGQINEGHSM